MEDSVEKLVDLVVSAAEKIEQALPGAFEAAVWRVQLSSLAWCGFWCLVAIMFCVLSVALLRSKDNELFPPGVMFACFSIVAFAAGGMQLVDLFAPEIPAAKMLIEVVQVR